MSEYDKESIRIYMQYHVSQLKHVGSKTKERWYEGQHLYSNLKVS